MKTDYVIIRRIWNGIEIEVRWQADYCQLDDGRSMAHLEVESISPRPAPLPITDTGYRSHFIQVTEIESMGNPEAYVMPSPVIRRRAATVEMPTPHVVNSHFSEREALLIRADRDQCAAWERSSRCTAHLQGAETQAIIISRVARA